MNNVNKRLFLVIHIAFWVLFLSFKFIDYNQNLQTAVALKLLGVQNGFNIIASYVHYFFLLPLVFKSKSYGKYLLLFLLLMFVVILGRTQLEAIFFDKVFGTDYYTKIDFLRVFNIFWTTTSFILFTSLMKFTKDKFVLEGEKKTLENEKLNAELNYLKAQINPHFLFNTLHNLNYLTQVKSDEATEVIVKLSNIMRYMIYESDKPLVPLHSEIAYLRDYLDLEKIRLNKSFDLTFDTSEVDFDIDIPPLILIPFVENAFKHGVSDANDKSSICIKLQSTKTDLVFQVENSLNKHVERVSERSGFGLENVKKRLDLSYGDQYSLDISPSAEDFRVTLKLELK
ncbi:sensor histidine kinase [Roseivirga sp. E12]|uniref:sensor histidine kinase n=1 Tax=Roseivirga sp. E12 TaxID=2819237 RepID=UPI001ABC44CE|nr:histidine kinase [Roseivirga sp. E12]MBO3699576.1 histidine kinase [Roseivirga sp. E12]